MVRTYNVIIEQDEDGIFVGRVPIRFVGIQQVEVV